ncbi:MAG: sensory histidine kinase AtoS, two-component system, NtrC family, sensor histidine kinase AtoS [Candidatus Wolfebacteria bacterium GW2011_GWC1_37_10]|uniref:histidine kinase n=1 Tax=Candidatus Wolfebacteria bacterium GW2011_GWC1_37_10 TaxID=1619010 RepID=A0A0G0FU18_9BACT|nr:MAG: sensory histidine kinase AtoS, two-component system, NtrC family, sensor histidine kinase AtoS [Candidatus Wolfebacteria bacterium GW2011_GWC1_37_10]
MDNILKFAKRLIECSSDGEVKKAIVEEGIAVFGADRACFIGKIKNDLLIEAGVPEDGHGLGEKITDHKGKKFLMEILSNRMPTVVERPLNDLKVFYMRDILGKYKVSEILFLPFFTRDEDIGILALDFTDGKKIQEGVFLKTKNFASFSVKALSAARKRKKEEENLLRMQQLIILGKNFVTFTHMAGNKLMEIGGLAKFLMKSELFDDKGKQYFATIASSISQIEKNMRDVLNFLKLKKIDHKKILLNQFLKDRAELLSSNVVSEGCSIRFKGDKRLEKIGIYFDPELLSDVLNDIVFNALESSPRPKTIVISGSLKPKSGSVRISVSNDGGRIDPEIKGSIFTPFVSGKGSTGLGLHNAETILKLHKGTIEINEKIEEAKGITSFEILMPITPRLS